MTPTIQISPERKLVGLRIRTTLRENKTTELWRAFMPRRKEIGNSLSKDLFSIEVYLTPTEQGLSAETSFDKWAAVEVAEVNSIPGGMEAIVVPGGLYAVFLYKGAASAFGDTFQYIFGSWLPTSTYSLDNRPHFEIMGERYKHEDPSSEEEIWIPVALREGKGKNE